MEKSILVKLTKIDSGEPVLVNFMDVAIIEDKQTHTKLTFGPPEYEEKVLLVEESFEDITRFIGL